MSYNILYTQKFYKDNDNYYYLELQGDNNVYDCENINKRSRSWAINLIPKNTDLDVFFKKYSYGRDIKGLGYIEGSNYIEKYPEQLEKQKTFIEKSIKRLKNASDIQNIFTDFNSIQFYFNYDLKTDTNFDYRDIKIDNIRDFISKKCNSSEFIVEKRSGDNEIDIRKFIDSVEDLKTIIINSVYQYDLKEKGSIKFGLSFKMYKEPSPLFKPVKIKLDKFLDISTETMAMEIETKKLPLVSGTEKTDLFHKIAVLEEEKKNKILKFIEETRKNKLEIVLMGKPSIKTYAGLSNCNELVLATRSNARRGSILQLNNILSIKTI